MAESHPFRFGLLKFSGASSQRTQAAQDHLKRGNLSYDDTSVKHWLESPSVLVGTIDQIVETLRLRREKYGFSYVSVFEPMEPFIPVIKRLAGT